MTFILRLVLFIAGLVFAASLAVAFLLLLLLWGLRAAWARLTGRPVSPFVMRINPRGGFDRMFRRAPQPGRAPGSRVDDVTDVEAKPPRSG